MLDRLTLITYTVLTNFVRYVKTPIPTWCYSVTYTKDSLANYVS